jgi:hypothetical protein
MLASTRMACCRCLLLSCCPLLQMPNHSPATRAAVAPVTQHISGERQQLVEAVPHLLSCALLMGFSRRFAARAERL